MNEIDIDKIAAVLDATAEYIEAIENERGQKQAAARMERINKLAESYEVRTGSDLPDEIKNKLASVDEDALEHLLKIANNSNASPELLGAPVDDNDSTITKEAADHEDADARFLNWITS